MRLFNRRELDTAPFTRQAVSPDYEGRLAFIGRLLDDQNCRSAVVLELSGNYIIRSTSRQTGELLLTELVLDDFEQGDVRSPIPPQPNSYETMLTAIGKTLDDRIAANVTIVEGQSRYHVAGWQRGYAGGSQGYVYFAETLDRFDLQRPEPGRS